MDLQHFLGFYLKDCLFSFVSSLHTKSWDLMQISKYSWICYIVSSQVTNFWVLGVQKIRTKVIPSSLPIWFRNTVAHCWFVFHVPFSTLQIFLSFFTWYKMVCACVACLCPVVTKPSLLVCWTAFFLFLTVLFPLSAPLVLFFVLFLTVSGIWFNYN